MNIIEPNSIGQFIKTLRIDKKETLHQVSKETDIDMTMLSKIERGERLPTVEQVKKISNYFELSENDIQATLMAEKIIKEFGINELTFTAVKIVEEKLITHLNEEKNEL
jgi:transcriptional regulator with XRE-family HTH domain